ncbi:hypothetical protein B2J93_5148 [Marssonina coronariae]|uniref:Uncharacterized protein n=1 Tax=Diplocarpon coronariae TaxID=2795749 RepID=A0A218ZF17_9HELO|nr:hypothetical protein B2J93_5148 [Marssonina coronariae]
MFARLISLLAILAIAINAQLHVRQVEVKTIVITTVVPVTSVIKAPDTTFKITTDVLTTYTTTAGRIDSRVGITRELKKALSLYRSSLPYEECQGILPGYMSRPVATAGDLFNCKAEFTSGAGTASRLNLSPISYTAPTGSTTIYTTVCPVTSYSTNFANVNTLVCTIERTAISLKGCFRQTSTPVSAFKDLFSSFLGVASYL